MAVWAARACMPEHKKHHYVPQFLLKHFAIPGKNDKAIAVADLEAKCIRSPVSIRDQCQRHYLYRGHNVNMEKELGRLESVGAYVIRNAITNRTIPDRGTPDWENFVGFMALQHGRTPGAGKYIDATSTGMVRRLLRGPFKPPDIPDDAINKAEVRHPHPEMLMILLELNLSPKLTDLEDLLILNSSDLEFVIPDVGIAYHNEWGRKAEHISGVLGASNHGLQIFLPISSRCLWVKYDPYVYSAPKGNVAHVSDAEDVRCVNRLMVAHAERNVYFSGNPFTKAWLEDWESHVRSPSVERIRFRTLAENGGEGRAVFYSLEMAKVVMEPRWLRVQTIAAFVPGPMRCYMYRRRSEEAKPFEERGFKWSASRHRKTDWLRDGAYRFVDE